MTTKKTSLQVRKPHNAKGGPAAITNSAIRRTARPCRCHYQEDRDWCYRLFQWNTMLGKWSKVVDATTPDVAVNHAAGLPRVLIVCLGCGADVLREY